MTALRTSGGGRLEDESVQSFGWTTVELFRRFRLLGVWASVLCDCGRGACCGPSVTCRETSSVFSDASNRILFSVG